MPETIILALIAAIGGGGLTAFITALFNRRKVTADATKIITDATKEILGEYRARNNELEDQLQIVRRKMADICSELEETKKQIQDTITKVLKLELINKILVAQLSDLGKKPAIAQSEWDTITIEELETIVNGLRSVATKRRRKQSSDD